jgi:hypothetical protein
MRTDQIAELEIMLDEYGPEHVLDQIADLPTAQGGAVAGQEACNPSPGPTRAGLRLGRRPCSHLRLEVGPL